MPSDQAVAFTPPSSLSESVADQLAEQIQDGTLSPGHRLVQTDLAAQFGISRVAVRDALKHLERRGLAVNIPRKGMIVRPLSEKTLRDLIIVWRAVDILAIGEAGRKVTPEGLRRLCSIVDEQEALADRGQYAAAAAKDEEFHLTIYELCDNEALQDIIAYLWPRTQQARGHAHDDTPERIAAWGKRSVAHHRMILATLEGRDTGERVVTSVMMDVERGLLEGLRRKG